MNNTQSNNERDEKKMSLLKAFDDKDWETVATMLSQTPVIGGYKDALRTPDKDGDYPIHRAIMFGAPLDIIQSIQKAHRSSLFKANHYGNLPIHIACSYKANLDIVQCVCEGYEEGLRQANQWGQLPIHCACLVESNDNLELIRYLHKMLPDCFTRTTHNGDLPLHCLCGTINPSLEIVRYIHKGYEDAAKTGNRNGDIPLHRICLSGGAPIVVVQYIYRAYPSGVNTKNTYGKTPLSNIEKGNISISYKQTLRDIFSNGEANLQDFDISRAEQANAIMSKPITGSIHDVKNEKKKKEPIEDTKRTSNIGAKWKQAIQQPNCSITAKHQTQNKTERNEAASKREESTKGRVVKRNSALADQWKKSIRETSSTTFPPCSDSRRVMASHASQESHNKTKESHNNTTTSDKKEDDNNIKVFISYSRTDWDSFVVPFLDKIKMRMNNKISIWVDQHLLVGGNDWMDSIAEALDECHVLILVMSPDALQSKYVKMEYRYFFNQDKPLIPILCRKVQKLPPELCLFQYIDFTNNTNSIQQESYEELFRILESTNTNDDNG